MQYYKDEIDVIDILEGVMCALKIKKEREVIVKNLKNRFELDKLKNNTLIQRKFFSKYIVDFRNIAELIIDIDGWKLKLSKIISKID